jgi:flagellar M-ring protein FliF
VQQVQSLWSAFDTRRRIVIAAATLAMFIAVLAVARFAASPGMALLYAGLDPAAAGEVVRALDQRGAAFEVRGDSIWVASGDRDTLRMALAGEGLPATGSRGYELLDSLSGFGTTAQMFDAAHLRAKEGELARTILALPQVRAARVHIALPSGQSFSRAQPPTASVTVTTASGGVSPLQARALRHLVAGAVAGMAPADVAVIDSAAGLLPAEDGHGMTGRAADDRADQLRENAERLLAARVGPGRAVVEVSVDLVTERESIVERRIDPQSRVAISTETEERSNSASGEGADAVTVASNLPEGDAAAGGGKSTSQGAESRERVNFEVSEIAREVDRAPGAVRRLTVAVLVDGVRAPDGSWTPRSEEELADLRDLVASAVGYDEARGDVITLKSMELDLPGGLGTAAAPGLFDRLDPMTLIQLVIAAVVVLVLGLFVLRPLLMAPGRQLADAAPLALPAAGAGAAGAAPVLTGVIDDGDLPPMAVVSRGEARPESEIPADPVERLRRLIAERQTESVEILRGWMEEREETR